MAPSNSFDFKLKEAQAKARARIRKQSQAQSLPEGAEVGGPLARALSEQSGDVVTVETPTGPLQFSRKGERVVSPDEMQQHLEGAEAKTRQEMLERLLSFSAGGDVMGFMRPLADVALGGDESAQGAIEAAKQAEREYPMTALTGAVASTAPIGAARALTPAASGGRFANLLRSAGAQRVLAGGLVGGIGGAPSGEGLAETARGTARGMVRGTLGQLAGEAVGLPIRAAAGKLGELASGAAERTRQAIEEAAAKAIATEKGHLGRLVASQSLGAEKLEAVINAPPGTYDAATVEEAQRILASPEGRVMLNRVALNAFDKLKEAFGAEPAQRAALQEAVAAATPEAVAGRTAQTLAPAALAKDLSGRAWRSVGQRALLGAGGAALGSMAGGAPGAGVGAIVGGIAPGMLQMMRNVAKAPKFQWAAASGLQSIAQPASDVARYMAPGIAQIQSVSGPDAMQAKRNAYKTLEQYLGLSAKDDEDLSNQAYIAGQTTPAAQPGRQ